MVLSTIRKGGSLTTSQTLRIVIGLQSAGSDTYTGSTTRLLASLSSTTDTLSGLVPRAIKSAITRV